jgi:hypothetical protein
MERSTGSVLPAAEREELLTVRRLWAAGEKPWVKVAAVARRAKDIFMVTILLDCLWSMVYGYGATDWCDEDFCDE